MSSVTEESYWIWPTTGDPLPTIGAGFRLVLATISDTAVDLRTQSGVEATVRRTMWDITPRIRNTGQSLAEAALALRNWKE